jgi:hypothetical protein
MLFHAELGSRPYQADLMLSPRLTMYVGDGVSGLVPARRTGRAPRRPAVERRRPELRSSTGARAAARNWRDDHEGRPRCSAACAGRDETSGRASTNRQRMVFVRSRQA